MRCLAYLFCIESIAPYTSLLTLSLSLYAARNSDSDCLTDGLSFSYAIAIAESERYFERFSYAEPHGHSQRVGNTELVWYLEHDSDFERHPDAVADAHGVANNEL